MELEELVSLSQIGLYALLNDNDKKVYVVYAQDMLNSLQRHLASLKLGSHQEKQLQIDFNMGKLRLVVLETGDGVKGLVDRYMKAEFLKDQFVKSGYSLYKQKPAIKLKTEVRIETNNATPYRVKAYLVGTNHNIPIGAFTYKAECDEFLKQHYSHSPYEKIIIAPNKLTELFIQSCGYRYRDVGVDVGEVSGDSDVQN